ncbi:helix-turn-helix domain-containing protein [Duganella callida]|uniref:AraC family transcriptional regulator n=1 Tax=Duganella callida TaxID=2561932 RepID=A0A4Y9SUQ5_9BURK|nr:helix-turn-helix domain-containing protein [Duganella callida]TFW30168.1 AraC family transcriptional regulator [Duganella callida]
MQPQEFAPPPALGDVIRCFWHVRREFGAQPSAFEVLPDGHAEIVFHFGGDCSVDGTPLPSPFLMGLLQRPLRLSAQGRFDVLGIRCFPWTVYGLLGMAPGGDGVCLFEHPLAGLQAALAQWVAQDRIDLAVASLSRHLLPLQTPVDAVLLRAGGAMRGAGGALPVSQVATAAHATVRTLERKFKQSSGRTVKDVSGLIRFEQVRNRLFSAPAGDLAALARELGYADQSHLSREFKRFAGTTPAAFARRLKKS